MDMVKGTPGRTPGRTSLFDHFKNNPGSLLDRIYGLIRIDFGERQRWGMWMQDASFHASDLAVAAGVLSPPLCPKNNKCLTRYDLKGKSRDQFREQEPGKMFTLENGDFRKKEMYMRVGYNDCELLGKAVAADTNFLDSWDMIDYSLFFVVVDKPNKVPLTCKDLATPPSCLESDISEKLYTISIIDYLNGYSALKVLESATHGGKFDQYGDKVSEYVQGICRLENRLEGFRPVKDGIRKRFPAFDATGLAFRKYSKNGVMNWYSFKELLEAMKLYDRSAADAQTVKENWKKVFKKADDHNKGYLDEYQFAWAFFPDPANQAER